MVRLKFNTGTALLTDAWKVGDQTYGVWYWNGKSAVGEIPPAAFTLWEKAARNDQVLSLDATA